MLQERNIIMKAAFLVLIVAVLSLQGSEAFLFGNIQLPSIPIISDLSKTLDGALTTVKNILQSTLKTAQPNMLLNVLSVTADLKPVFALIHN